MSHPKFYELPVWLAARKLQQSVTSISRQGAFGRDWRLRNQIQDAAASVMANIAEGFSRRYDKERVQFFFLAKSSGSEVESHLFVALDRGYLDERTFQEVFDSAENVVRQISGFISFLTGHKSRRPKTPS
jgi:four helix bundle protein